MELDRLVRELPAMLVDEYPDGYERLAAAERVRLILLDALSAAADTRCAAIRDLADEYGPQVVAGNVGVHVDRIYKSIRRAKRTEEDRAA